MHRNEIDASFFCDTDFQWTQHKLDLAGVVALIKSTDESRIIARDGCGWVIATGGEPTLQLDDELVEALHAEGYKVALETNGTRELPRGIDWVSCSPKRGSKVVLARADEIRIVIADGEEPGTHGIQAAHRFVSPACWAPNPERVRGHEGKPSDIVHANVAWAIRWCLINPLWRMSVQQHKTWGIR